MERVERHSCGLEARGLGKEYEYAVFESHCVYLVGYCGLSG